MKAAVRSFAAVRGPSAVLAAVALCLASGVSAQQFEELLKKKDQQQAAAKQAAGGKHR